MMILSHLPRLFAPEPGDTGGGDTATIDFGDDHTPTDDEPTEVVEPKKAEPKKAEAKDEKDVDPDNPDADEDEVEDPKAEKDKPKKVDTRIPLARHTELLKKERDAREDLQRQLAKFKGGEELAVTNAKITQDETSLIEMEKELAKMNLDGDHVKAGELMTKIRHLERGIGEAKLQLTSAAAEARAYERVRYDTTVERLEGAYPTINPDHDDYDEAVVRKVMRMKTAYQTEGYTPAQALQAAAKDILGVETTKQTSATEVEVRVDKADVAKQVAKDRKVEAVKKNVDVAKKQPSSNAGVGADSDKAGAGIVDPKAIIHMKYNDFVKLDEAALSRMRGDDL